MSVFSARGMGRGDTPPSFFQLLLILGKGWNFSCMRVRSSDLTNGLFTQLQVINFITRLNPGRLHAAYLSSGHTSLFFCTLWKTLMCRYRQVPMLWTHVWPEIQQITEIPRLPNYVCGNLIPMPTHQYGTCVELRIDMFAWIYGLACARPCLCSNKRSDAG